MSSPTQRALADLKKQGITCQIVERWNPWAKIRQDLFQGIDIVALTENSIMGIQVTSDSHHSARVHKIKAEPRLREWLRCGGRIQVWSYGKKGATGKRKLWTRRVEEITLEGCQSFSDENQSKPVRKTGVYSSRTSPEKFIVPIMTDTPIRDTPHIRRGVKRLP